MPSPFTQHSEDTCRLPDNTTRIGYNSDTSRYLFRDSLGQLYESASHDEYGELTPVDAPSAPKRNVSVTEIHDPRLSTDLSSTSSQTFNDFLPEAFIAAPLTPSDVKSKSKANGNSYRDNNDSKSNNAPNRFIYTIRQCKYRVPRLRAIVEDVVSRSKGVAGRADRRRTGAGNAKSETRERGRERYRDEKSKLGVETVDSEELDEHGLPPYKSPKEWDWEV